MSVESFDPRGVLRRLLAEGAVSVDALTAITGIPAEALGRFVTDPRDGGMSRAPDPTGLGPDATERLSDLVARLSVGMAVGDDERLRAILETLTISLRVPTTSIAELTGIAVGDIESALRDPRQVDAETRYALAVRASYLLHAAGDAAPRHDRVGAPRATGRGAGR